jgi:alkanesulfonate monooxygenase SsuD/methylene tetrahydromethanopterin reductase-like flavin-dependent oxidoreductase (luciferase family)
MPEVAIMIEGQEGLGWGRWRRLARTVEDSGYAGLFRSDHFTNPTGPVLDALELWSSLTWLADNTSRIEFGPLVSPVSFRHPVITAWTASTVDNLAGARARGPRLRPARDRPPVRPLRGGARGSNPAPAER